MSGSEFVLFALGLMVGGGIVFYLLRAGEDSRESRGRSRSGSTESTSGALEDEAASKMDGGSSLDVEELMGLEDEGGHSGATDGGGEGAEAEMVAGGAAVETSTDTRADFEDAEGAATHWLEGISGSIAGKRYLIDEPTSVGRLPRNDLQLNEGDVSRVHCRFRPEGDMVRVEALDTPNGTRVNDRELEPGEPVTLSDEDVIEVGKVLLMYHFSEADELPEGLADESSEVAFSLGADAATVSVDTTDWRERIVNELEAAGGDISVAAQALGMDPDALERLAERLEFD